MLASLLQEGFDVPEGIVLTTEAFAAAGRDPILPEGVERALLQVADHFDGAPLAVRSSAEAEDLAETSFAGQYETVLGVRNPKELTQAVVHCWTSASSERVTAYRNHRHGKALGGMAVLIQRLVEAEAAGVAFTADPVSGDPSTTIVEAVAGLADRAVAGEVTPERWMTEGGGEPEREGPPEPVLKPSQAKEVVGLARRVADHLGAPQDVEWAVADGRVWLLQSRPITTLPDDGVEPIPVPVEIPDGYWERETSHAPLPHSPLFRSFAFPLRNRVVPKMFEEFGALPETIEFREIGGWEYIRLVPPGGKDRPAPPAWVLGLLARIHPAMRRRVKAAREAIETDRSSEYLERWQREWRPEFEAEIIRLRDTDRWALSDQELEQHLSELLAYIDRAAEAHFLLHGALMVPTYELALACEELLGWEEHRMYELLGGLSTMSTQPARRLAELAAETADRPWLRELLDRVGPGTWDRIAEEDPVFAEALEAYRHEYGCRALRYEVAEPTLGEDRALILQLIREQIKTSFDPEQVARKAQETREQALEEASQVLASRPEGDRRRFNEALRKAEAAYPVREDREWYTISATLALVRFIAQELGRRMAERGQIEQPDDVFFLEIDEVRAAFREGNDQRALVRTRRGERVWVEAHPGPPSYGEHPGPPPPLDALPEEARLVNRTIVWYMDRVFETERSGTSQDPGAHVLRGIGASAGRYEGTVRVIMGEDEFGKLEAGDVVVCPITSPVWSVVFPNMGALVTDTGGILSHPAIIAREFRIPAVVATGNATSLLRDGQTVVVDGRTGAVELVNAQHGSQLETNRK